MADAKTEMPLSVAIMGQRSMLFDLWLKPIAGPLDEIAGTADKPVSELTVAEALSWIFVIGYVAATGLALSGVAINIARGALGPYRR